MSDSPASGVAEITITRVFDAPRELVWKAWTEPEQFAHWFGGADATIPLDSVSMDVRPGGEFQARMIIGPGEEIPWRGIYEEVVEPERLVFKIADRPGDEYELCTVVLTDAGGKTQMLFEQTGGHMDAAGYARANEGWLSFFDSMEGLLPAQSS
jgi:uncharacterized protein YndB with AHSA1/START domain